MPCGNACEGSPDGPMAVLSTSKCLMPLSRLETTWKHHSKTPAKCQALPWGQQWKGNKPTPWGW